MTSSAGAPARPRRANRAASRSDRPRAGAPGGRRPRRGAPRGRSQPNRRPPRPRRTHQGGCLVMSDLAQDLAAFITAAPTPYHTVAEGVRRLAEAGFAEQPEAGPWEDGPGGRYLVRD